MYLKLEETWEYWLHQHRIGSTRFVTPVSTHTFDIYESDSKLDAYYK